MMQIRRAIAVLLLTALSGSGTITTQRGTTDTLDAAVINTTETPFATTNYPVRAGYFTANRRLRVELYFSSTTSGTPVTQRLRLRIGTSAAAITGTIVYDSTAFTPSVSLVTRNTRFVFDLIGTAAAGASVALDAESGSGGMNATTVTSVANTIAQPVPGLATNGILYVTPTLQFSGNTAGNTTTLTTVVVQEF